MSQRAISCIAPLSFRKKGQACDSLSVRLRLFNQAAIAQLGERQTEDLKVPGSIPGLGTFCEAR